MCWPNRWVVRSASTGESAEPSKPATRSASTAPASTEASWSGSPTRTSRASGRTASSSRAIIVSETIEVSSTTITSCGSRLARWWRNRTRLSGRQPSRRCSVEDCRPSRRARSTGSSSSAVASCTASCSRAAALPVGALRAIRGGWPVAGSCCSATSASRPATVVVLPVPGPPVSTVVQRPAAARAAARCSSYPSRGKTRTSPASRAAASTSGGVRWMRSTRSSQT